MLTSKYVYNGGSGTDFSRPGVTDMLNDAKEGNFNLIICKDTASTKLLTSIKPRYFAFFDKFREITAKLT